MTGIGFLVSAVFLGIFLWGIDYRRTWEALEHANYLWLVPAMLSIAASLVVRAYRWRLFLGPEQRQLGIPRLFNTLTIGFFGNTVLPARAGELLRPYMLARTERSISFTEALATVVVERVFDLIAVIVAFALLLIVAPFPPEALERYAREFAAFRSAGWILGTGCLVITVFLCLLVRAPEKYQALFVRWAGWLPSAPRKAVVAAIERFAGGLSTFKSLSAAGKAMLWTVVVWFTILLSEYFTILAFGFGVSLFGTMILMAVLAFAVMVPQGPGYLGPFQLACALTLEACFMVPRTEANAFAIVLWLAHLLPILVLGIVCLHLEGFTLRQLVRSIKAHQEEEEAR